MFFYYRKRVTGWGPERAAEHPDFAFEKFKHTTPVACSVEEKTMTLAELETRYPREPVAVFATTRKKEDSHAQPI